MIITKSQKKDILSLINVLSVNYQAWGPKEPEQYEFYIQLLADLDPMLLNQAVLEHVKTSKYGPTIADLRAYVLKAEAEKKFGKLLTDNEAWQEVQHAIGFYGQYDFEKAIESFNLVVREVVKKIGFIRLCTMDQEKAEQRFKSLYKEHVHCLINIRTATNLIELGKVE